MVILNWSGYYKITPLNVENLPTIGGVYKLTTYNVQSKKYNFPFYVGQAIDIKARTQQHVSPNEQNSCIKDKFDKFSIYINYSSVSKQSDRDAVEVALYRHYLPSCNDPKALPNIQPAEVSSFN